MAELHVPPQLAATLDERGNHCFGCGAENPQGLHLHFRLTDAPDITAEAELKLTRLHEGPPGYVHGGIVATLLDEAMSKLNRPLGVLAMTRHMAVDYLRPAPLETGLLLRARHERREGRKLFHQAQLLAPDGTVLASATAVFVVIDAAMLDRLAKLSAL